MMRRFGQFLMRTFGRRTVEDVEGVGPASRETLHDVGPASRETVHDALSLAQQVKVGQIACFQVNETSGNDPCATVKADVVGDGHCTGSVTNVVGDERPWKYEVSSYDEESSVYSKTNNANTGRWATACSSDNDDAKSDAVVERWHNIDLDSEAYDADIDEMPGPDGKMTRLSEEFSDAVNGGHVPWLRSHADEAGGVEKEPGVDVVGADVVGDATRVREMHRRDSDVRSFDDESSVRSNANNANPDRWETPYSSDTEPWDDDSDDDARAKVDLDSKEKLVTGEVTNAGKEPRDQLHLGKLETSLADGKTTGFSEGFSDAVNVGHVTGLNSEVNDVDVVGEKRGVDAISHESDLTSVSQVSADQYSVNDDWRPTYSSDSEPLEEIDEELVRQESGARVFSFGKQSSDQSTVVGVREKPRVQSNVVSFGKQPNVQSNVVSLSKRPSVQSNVVRFDKQPNVQSKVASFGKQPSGQSRTTTHKYTTVFLSDHESDEELVAYASKTSAGIEPPGECSRPVASVDAGENMELVVKVDVSTVGKETSAAQSEGVRVRADLNVTPNTTAADCALPVVDEEPVTWVKSGDDFDWDDADSDTDSKPPFRLLCGCFPSRRRRSIQLRRYRIKKVTKEEVHKEQEAKNKNFVEVKCPKAESSFKWFLRSH